MKGSNESVLPCIIGGSVPLGILELLRALGPPSGGGHPLQTDETALGGAGSAFVPSSAWRAMPTSTATNERA